MSIERVGQVITFQCDTCPDAFDPDSTDFAEAWAEAKENGWRATKVDGEWMHSCPDCAENV